MKNTCLIALLVIVLLAGLLLWGSVVPIRAESDSGKLGTVLANQREIISRLDAIKADLNKIRIRVSSQ